MIISLILALAAPAQCADTSTAQGMREMDNGMPGCQPKGDRKPDRKTTPADTDKVKTYFDGVLFDGQSARYKLDFVKAGVLICGQVNAKNRMGAYTGWTPFYYLTTSKSGEILNEENKFMFEACRA